MDMKTKFRDDILRSIDDVDEHGDPVQTSLMFRRDIPQFRTEFFARSMRLYNNWKLFRQAPPRGMGFAEERTTTIDILMILEEESNLYDAWEREKASKKKG